MFRKKRNPTPKKKDIMKYILERTSMLFMDKKKQVKKIVTHLDWQMSIPNSVPINHNLCPWSELSCSGKL